MTALRMIYTFAASHKVQLTHCMMVHILKLTKMTSSFQSSVTMVHQNQLAETKTIARQSSERRIKPEKNMVGKQHRIGFILKSRPTHVLRIWARGSGDWVSHHVTVLQKLINIYWWSHFPSQRNILCRVGCTGVAWVLGIQHPLPMNRGGFSVNKSHRSVFSVLTDPIHTTTGTTTTRSRWLVGW